MERAKKVEQQNIDPELEYEMTHQNDRNQTGIRIRQLAPPQIFWSILLDSHSLSSRSQSTHFRLQPSGLEIAWITRVALEAVCCQALSDW